jgi:glucosamine kinase
LPLALDETGGMIGAPLYLGVDGGATRCRARLRDAEGRALAEATGAAANIHVDFAAAIAALRAVVGAVLAKAGLGDCDPGTIAIGLGLAGFKEASDATRVAAAFPGFRLVRAANDATTACIGAHAGADGGLIIAGTGSAAIARVQGKETIIGGRGFSVGDDGSGSHVGLDALRAAMRAYDGLAPSSPLTRDIIGQFGADPVAMVSWARDAKPGDFGTFAPRVFEHAAEHDPVALEIAGRAAGAIGALIRGVVALGAERAALVGGVGESLHPYLEPDIAARLKAPLYDAVDGAILFVGGVIAPEREAAQ